MTLAEDRREGRRHPPTLAREYGELRRDGGQKAEGKTACRVCGSSKISEAGRVQYLEGFDWPVLDCDDCGCRFTPHDPAVHQTLHTAPAISYYAEYLELAEKARALFASRNLEALSQILRQWPKYRFVLDQIAREPASSKILEVGCSRGYLTACPILEGRNVLGVDVSEEAIAGATQAFGDHFAVAESPRMASNAPFDLIYHVGMIGCVSDPIGVTRKLLSMLRPGGRLIFNAPNRAALHQPGQLWFDSAPPPDLVTLFPEGFWARRFAAEATVQETVETLPADRSAMIAIRNWFGRKWTPPTPRPMAGRAQVWGREESTVWRLMDRVITLLLKGGTKVPPLQLRPTEFGLFVQMTARGR